jgi:hypothetical protein
VIEDLVLGERTLSRGWYCPETVRALADAHLARRANHARVLGTIATLEQWLRTHETDVREPVTARVNAAGDAVGTE